MKNVKLIDALPTLFGIFALVGFLMFAPFHPGTRNGPEGTLGPMLLYGAGVVAFITGVASIIRTSRKSSFIDLRLLNLVWVLLIGGYFGYVIWVGLNFSVG
jgi:hypothetical protein